MASHRVLLTNYLSRKALTSYSLRNSDFDIPTFNTINYGKHSLRYQEPHIWSKLHDKLKDILNLLKRILGKTIAAVPFAILTDYLLYTHCFIVQFVHATYFTCLHIFVIISYL